VKTVATFAAGCFWGVEEAFRHLDGVLETTVGYTGGTVPTPTYRQVCTGETGHAEAVQVEFDSGKITYEKLLSAFWDCHDPTTLNRQGPDIGTQYRSAIFYHDAAQEKIAQQSKADWQSQFDRPIITEIVPAGPFYKAEEYHQRYLEKQGLSTCPIGDKKNHKPAEKS